MTNGRHGEFTNGEQGGGLAVCKALIETSNRDLFQNNVFRITGLSIRATSREIAKHGDRLKLLEELGGGEPPKAGPFARQPSPTLDEIRTALQRLKKPESRIIDEFFWFWPDGSKSGESDAAMQALQAGDDKLATSFWRQLESASPNAIIATHNLAIAHYLVALDRENRSVGTPDTEEHRKRTEGHWQSAIKRWLKLAIDDGFWQKLAERIEILNEPSLNIGFAHEMRASLLVALGKVHAELALAYADKRQAVYAQAQVSLLKQICGESGADIVAGEIVLKPLTTRLKQHIQKARERAGKNAADAAEAALELLRQAKPAVEKYDLLVGHDATCRTDLFNEIAETCYRLQVTFWNATKNDKTCLEILQEILPYPSSQEVRKRIEDDFYQTKHRLTFAHTYSLLKYINESKERPIARLELFRAKVAPLLSSADSQHASADPLLERLFDTAAMTLRSISLDAWNVTDDLTTAISANSSALTLVRGSEPRQLINGDKAKLAGFEAVRVSQANARIAAAKKTSRGNVIIGASLFGFIVLMVIVGANSEKSSTSASRGTPRESSSTGASSASAKPAFNPDTYLANPSGNRTTYSVPDSRSSELAVDREAIDRAKAEVNALQARLDALGGEIERERPYVDNTSQYAIDAFNAKVNTYNALVVTTREHNERANQMVDAYNEKLAKYGR